MRQPGTLRAVLKNTSRSYTDFDDCPRHLTPRGLHVTAHTRPLMGDEGLVVVVLQPGLADLIRFGLHGTASAGAVQGRHFEAEMIVLCGRWHLRCPPSWQLEGIMAERNLSVDHVTLWRWVQ